MTKQQRNGASAWSLRKRFDNFELKKVDRSVERDLRHGWMLPIIVQFDSLTWGRWDYHMANIERGHLLDDDPIPEIWFEDHAHPQTRKMIEQCLNAIPDHGAWGTWGSATYIDYFLDWVLFAMGDPAVPQLPAEPVGCSGASMRLYQLFQAETLNLWPHDYIGDLLCETSFGRGAAFYPTPHTLVQLMAKMEFPDEAADYRRDSVMDPCVGTGRMLLYSSNYSLNLYGMDILPTCCKATRFNAAFMAPWLFRSLPWIGEKTATYEIGAELASQIATLTGVRTWDSVLVQGGQAHVVQALQAEWPEDAALSVADEDEGKARRLTAAGVPCSHGPIRGSQWDRVVLFPALGEVRDCDAVRDAYQRLAPGGKLVAIMADWWTLCEGERFQQFREWINSPALQGQASWQHAATDGSTSRTMLVTIKKESIK